MQPTVSTGIATEHPAATLLPRFWLLLLGVAAVTLAGCTDSPTATPKPPRSPRMEIVSGDNQTGEVGTDLSLPLVIRVVDSLGRPMAGRPVSFFSSEGTISPDSTTTDFSGVASVLRWTLGVRAGIQSLNAYAYIAGSRIGVVAVAFKATAAAGPPAGVHIAAGDSAVALPGTALDTLVAYVTDRFGNGIREAAVRWTVVEGGGQVDPGPLSRADQNGAVRAVWTIGPQLGRNVLAVAAGDTAAHFTATSTTPLIAATVSVGGGHSCALAPTGVAYCWGVNHSGQLGDGWSGSWQQRLRKTAVRVRGTESFVSLAAGAQHTCGVTAAGAAYCWGDNASGQLGDGTSTTRAEPAPVSLGLSGFAALAAGASHTCGLTHAGGALCWGDNTYGQLGDGTTTQHKSPTAVLPARTFTALVAGDGFTCGVSEEGVTYCWGRNGNGELGASSTAMCGADDYYYYYYYGPQPEPCSLVPLPVANNTEFVVLAAGLNGTCGMSRDAEPYCWGAGMRVPQVIPGIPHLTSVVTGAGTACGTSGSGELYCWHFGEGPDATLPPRVVAEGLQFASLSGYASHFCGVVNSAPSLAYCWGANSFGQLGDGTTRARGAPVQIVSPVNP